MNRYIRNIAFGGFLAATLSIQAQNTNSGYFLDGYTYRYQMNPAFANDKNFVSMPGLGNLNVGVDGTLKLSSVLYNVDGRTCLFTNPNISAEEVMKNIGEILKEAGRTYTDVVKTTCFLADMSDFAAFNQVYGTYFTGKPARSCVAVKALPLGVLCEVEVIVSME